MQVLSHNEQPGYFISPRSSLGAFDPIMFQQHHPMPLPFTLIIYIKFPVRVLDK